jgi:hypothetical protein
MHDFGSLACADRAGMCLATQVVTVSVKGAKRSTHRNG